MASISLFRTLLCLLSLSSISLGSDQYVLQEPNKDTPNQDSLPLHGSLVLLTKTVTYDGHPQPTDIQDQPNTISTPSLDNNIEPSITCPLFQKQCNNTCIPTTQDCCSVSDHCQPGDYCYHHQGSIRCCPEGMSCYQISGDICYKQVVLWVEEVHIVEIDTEEGEDGSEKMRTTTSWELQSSTRVTKTGLTVTASYPYGGRASFVALSEEIREEMSVSLALGVLSTRTVMALGTSTFTSTPAEAESESTFDKRWAV